MHESSKVSAKLPAKKGSGSQAPLKPVTHQGHGKGVKPHGKAGPSQKLTPDPNQSRSDGDGDKD